MRSLHKQDRRDSLMLRPSPLHVVTASFPHLRGDSVDGRGIDQVSSARREASGGSVKADAGHTEDEVSLDSHGRPLGPARGRDGFILVAMGAR